MIQGKSPKFSIKWSFNKKWVKRKISKSTLFFRTFEEIDFALVTLDSSKQEPNFSRYIDTNENSWPFVYRSDCFSFGYSSDELYEPVGRQSDLEKPLILDQQPIVNTAIITGDSLNKSQTSEVATERPKEELTHQRSRRYDL